VKLLVRSAIGLILATAPEAFAQTAPGAGRAKVPFAVGERMEYEVRFGRLKVGNAHMEVVALEQMRGRTVWHTAFWVQGGNFLYRVNDVYESWIDAETLSSLKFVQELNEGGKNTERRFEMFPERATFIQTNKKDAKEEKSVPNPLDDGSFLYFIRSIPLEVGQTYDFNRYFRPDRNPVRIKVLRKEKIRVPAGAFDAIVLQPEV